MSRQLGRISLLLLLLTAATSGYIAHALSVQMPEPKGATSASPKPHAYLIYVRSTTNDADGYQSYSSKVPSTYVGRTYQALVLNGPITPLEGTAPQGVVVVQFPNVEAAKSQYFSDAYQEIAGQRRRSAKGAMFIVEGVPPTNSKSMP
jgi:uncharacterized protein (DUF1330 family)